MVRLNLVEPEADRNIEFILASLSRLEVEGQNKFDQVPRVRSGYPSGLLWELNRAVCEAEPYSINPVIVRGVIALLISWSSPNEGAVDARLTEISRSARSVLCSFLGVDGNIFIKTKGAVIDVISQVLCFFNNPWAIYYKEPNLKRLKDFSRYVYCAFWRNLATTPITQENYASYIEPVKNSSEAELVEEIKEQVIHTMVHVCEFEELQPFIIGKCYPKVGKILLPYALGQKKIAKYEEPVVCDDIDTALRTLPMSSAQSRAALICLQHGGDSVES